jgi:hypothetical protein
MHSNHAISMFNSARCSEPLVADVNDAVILILKDAIGFVTSGLPHVVLTDRSGNEPRGWVVAAVVSRRRIRNNAIHQHRVRESARKLCRRAKRNVIPIFRAPVVGLPIEAMLNLDIVWFIKAKDSFEIAFVIHPGSAAAGNQQQDSKGERDICSLFQNWPPFVRFQRAGVAPVESSELYRSGGFGTRNQAWKGGATRRDLGLVEGSQPVFSPCMRLI